MQCLGGLARAAGIDATERLEAHARFDDAGISYASGCHAAVVTVDIPTGIVRVLDYAVTHDCGRVANPTLVDGQIMGGVVQGLGAALFEALQYDSDGLPLSRGLHASMSCRPRQPRRGSSCVTSRRPRRSTRLA